MPSSVRDAGAATRWSKVVRSASGSAAGRAALAWLCERYWGPLNSFVRRRGYSHQDAEDLTQEFFARLLERGGFAGADPDRGRFRSYLLACLGNFLANDQEHRHALKRGGGRRPVPLDSLADGGPAHADGPDRSFDRDWAGTVIAHSVAALAEEHAAAGRSAVFEALRGFLASNADAGDYARAGASLGMSEGAVKVAVHRLRARYRDLLRREVAETLDEPGTGALDAELRWLIDAVR